MGAEHKLVFKARKVAWCISCQINGVHFLVSAVSGAAIVANLGKNFLYYRAKPRIELSISKFSGGSKS